MGHLLMIEDDARLAGMVADYLAASGHEVRHAGDAQSGLAQLAAAPPELVILELMDTPAAADALRERTRHEILRNMAELDQLIDEILLASRLDAREADLGTVEAVDLVGLCAEECARVGAEFAVPEGMTALEVSGVARLLRRMVRNLLENAQRYGAKPGADTQSVLLSLAAAKEQVLLSVCDRGPGVPPEYRERIFEPFFRLPGARVLSCRGFSAPVSARHQN